MHRLKIYIMYACTHAVYCSMPRFLGVLASLVTPQLINNCMAYEKFFLEVTCTMLGLLLPQKLS